MKYILIKTQWPVSIITNLLNQYSNIKAQKSVEIQPLENYENSTVVFDDMLLPKHKNKIDLFFTRGRHSNFDEYYIRQRFFHIPKMTVRNISSIILTLFKQTLRYIIVLFHDIAGLDMDSEEWKTLCGEAWKIILII